MFLKGPGESLTLGTKHGPEEARLVFPGANQSGAVRGPGSVVLGHTALNWN